MPAPGIQRLGRYEIQAELGHGSMGIVYLARDPLIGRLVALKVFRTNLAGDDEELGRFRSRFLREAQSAGILSHPNIVTIHDVVEKSAEGATFIAMEYVQGSNLKELLRFGRPLALDAVLEIVRQIAEALDYAHSKGVVHRDVKPANVLLTPDRQVKITDFGIARFDTSNLTVHGQLLGTPNYMSPEQVQGRDVDHRSDLFSLGVIVYELITRQKPFQGDSVAAVTHRIVYEPFTPAEEYVGELPPGLRRLFSRALAKRPERRYARAGELADELERAASRTRSEAALSATQSVPPPAAASEEHDTLPGTVVTPPPPASPEPPAGWRRRLAAGFAPLGRRLAPLGRRVAPARRAALAVADRLLPHHRPPPRRLGLVVAVTVTACLAVGLPLLMWVRHAGGGGVAAGREERLRAEYLDLVREGLRKQHGGDPLGAAVDFGRAEVLAPERPRIAELRRQAEQEARESRLSAQRAEQVALQVEAAQAALDAGRYQEALATAGVVLEVDPDHPDAASIAGRARRELAREAAARRRAAAAPPPAPPQVETETAQPAETAAAGAADRAEPVKAFLSVRLEAAGEGTFRLTSDGRLLVNWGYENVDRKGLFRRKEPYRGVLTFKEIEVEPGAHQLDLSVTPDGAPARTTSLEADFPAGSTRHLEIVLDDDGTLHAALDGT